MDLSCQSFPVIVVTVTVRGRSLLTSLGNIVLIELIVRESNISSASLQKSYNV